MTSPKTIAKIRTYDAGDCTSTGYRVDVREDGSLRIESHSRWQGSTTGTVWRSRATEDIVAAARAAASGEELDDDAPDLEALIDDFLAGDWKDRARRIRIGYRVR